jgi:hypothetical protein
MGCLLHWRICTRFLYSVDNGLCLCKIGVDLAIVSCNDESRKTRYLLHPLNVGLTASKDYLFITYIVTSKPKRISVAAGLVHMI